MGYSYRAASELREVLFIVKAVIGDMMATTQELSFT